MVEDDTTLNKFNIELNIKQLQDEAEDYMMKAACTEGDKTKYLDEVEKIFGKVKVLREQLELLEASSIETDSTSLEKDKITELFERMDFGNFEYDDLIVRRLIECIKIMGDKTVSIIFKGGMEIKESLND